MARKLTRRQWAAAAAGVALGAAPGATAAATQQPPEARQRLNEILRKLEAYPLRPETEPAFIFKP